MCGNFRIWKSGQKGDKSKIEFCPNLDFANKLFAVVAAVGIGYVIYRGVRGLPFMLLPFW